MANGAFKFKDNTGNVVASLSNNGSNIVITGGTLDLSGMTGLTMGSITMSGTTSNATSASHAASYLLTSSFNSYTGTTNTIIGTLATTGSNQFKSDQTITGSLTVTGFIDAQELRTTYISSSILYRSGSTKFGDELTDTHLFSGSMYVSGGIGINTTSSLSSLDVRTISTYGVSGTVTGSYPIASLINTDSNGGLRGLQFGGPTGGVNSPVFLKVYGTGVRFSLLDQNNVENLTIVGGNVGINKGFANAQLDVNGNAIISGSLTTTGTINGLSIPNDLFAQQFLLMGA